MGQSDDEINESSVNNPMAELVARVAQRVNGTNGGDALTNYANVGVDRYDGALSSVVWAVVREIADPHGHAMRFWAQMGRLAEAEPTAPWVGEPPPIRAYRFGGGDPLPGPQDQ